jgi:endoglucanase
MTSTFSVRRACLLILLLAVSSPSTVRSADDVPDSSIRLNTVGFLPAHLKRASVAVACTDFSIINDADGTIAFRGKTSGPVYNSDTNENLYIADFSALKQPGVYRLDVLGVGRSAPFRIGRDVYDFAFRTVLRAMHLWRCGTAVRAEHSGIVYSHAACHLDDAWLDLAGGGHARRESTKGWHDAGDYNKYVVNAGVTLGIMFRAWEEFGPRIQKSKLDAAEDERGLPAYLNEIKWETDWLFTMQASDGSVYHKVSTKEFGPAIMPENEKTQRYFAPWSSAATADFVAVTAMAARAFQPYDEEYARRCLEAARKSYAFLRAHPENKRADLKDFRTGAYQTDDVDDRLWAAAEMWETTGETVCLTDFESRARAFKFSANWGWGNVENLGLLTYLFSKRGGRDSKFAQQVRDDLIATADSIVNVSDVHGYARPLGKRYYWGCNGGVANTTLLLQAANHIAPKPAYVETALDALSHLFGRNYYGRSFVTGLGANPPLHPHDRRSMGQTGASAWPGYLIGGGWPRATDWKDESSIYQVNEIAINWNAPLIYALAGFIE